MRPSSAAKRIDVSRPPGERRMPRAERMAAMLELALPVLADRGFAVSTRALAEALGVTQALIYKHFPSKEAFISAALARAFGRESRESAILREESLPLGKRLAAFYSGRADRASGSRMRLMVRAALEGWPTPARRGAALTRQVFAPVVSALRKEAGLPSLQERPMQRGERELAMMLHGSIVFLGIREHVYHMPMPDDRDAIIRLHVDIFIGGALAALRRIHAGDAGASLTVTQLAPGGTTT